MLVPLTKETDLWNANEKMVFIEDYFWMSKQPECLQGYTYELLDVDYNELGVNEEAMWSFAVRTAETAGDILNKYHGTEFTHQYWRRTLFPWLKWFVPAIYLRFFRLCALRDRYPHEMLETNILGEEHFSYIPLNAEEFLQTDGAFVDVYGHHLYALILKHVGFNIKTNTIYIEQGQICDKRKQTTEVNAAPPLTLIERVACKVKEPYRTLKLCALYLINKIMPSPDPGRVEIILSGFGSRYLGMKLSAYSRGRVVWHRFDQPIWIPVVKDRPAIQHEFRQEAGIELKKMVTADSDCERLLLHLFFQEIPCSYLENFEECRVVYSPYYEKFPRLKYILSFAGAEFTESKMAMVEQCERGVKFSYIAHGSIRPNQSDKFAFGRILSDISYLWGRWDNDQLDPNVINYREAPAEKLFIYDKLSAQPSSDILYLGDWATPFLHRLNYHTLGRLLQQERTFLTALEDDVRQDLLVRNYPYEFLSMLDRWLQHYFPDIRISRAGMGREHENFPQLLMNSRLIILDHAETPFLEVLYANKPFLLYFDEDFIKSYFDPNTEQLYVDMMREVGLIQYGPEAAAKYLNEIYPRIEEWWAEPWRQRVVQIIKERYVGSYMDPDEWWCKEIMGMLKGDITW